MQLDREWFHEKTSGKTEEYNFLIRINQAFELIFDFGCEWIVSKKVEIIYNQRYWYKLFLRVETFLDFSRIFRLLYE